MHGNDTFIQLERAVMEMLLAGEHPVLRLLRAQFEHARVVRREFTGVGFFTHFEIPEDFPRVPGRASFELDDVHADVPELTMGIDFILFVRDGVIDFLEGFTYGDDRFPETIDTFRLTYVRAANGVVGGRTSERDWEALRRLLGGIKSTLR